MFSRIARRTRRSAHLCLSGLLAISQCVAQAQEIASPASVPASAALIHKVSAHGERLEMTVNSSRILTMDHKIPRVQVSNPEIIAATPISANDVQIHAKKTGITQVNLWDEKGQIHAIDVVVLGDVKELSSLIKSNFPEAAVTVQPTSTSVILKGYVDKPESVLRIVRIAEDYYPRVINNITVGGAQQVMLHVKVMEVSRTKLRELGFDFANVNTVTGSLADGGVRSSVTGLLPGFAPSTDAFGGYKFPQGETLSFGIVNGGNTFYGVLKALQRNKVAKVLAEPTLVTVSGRPAYFQSGGEIPILIPQGLGNVSVEFRSFGTQVDFVPIVLGDGKIRLEVRPRVSELDYSISTVLNGSVIPGFRTRQVDTGVEMRAGQTLALAGLIQTRVESEKAGIPWVSDLPYIGAPFRDVRETQNEIELLILVRPELAEPLDPEEVPPCGPGENTMSPRDIDLYMKGFIEVPNPECMGEGCNINGCNHGRGANELDHQPGATGTMIEEVPKPQPTPSLQPEGSAAAKAGPRTAARGVSVSNPAARTNARPATSRTVGGNPGTNGTSRRQNPPVVNVPQSESPAYEQSGEPGLIGPTGYDVIN